MSAAADSAASSAASRHREQKGGAGAEAFVGTLQSKRLRDWYRFQLGLLQSQKAYAAKAAVLHELAGVLDRPALRALQDFLGRCMQQQQQQQEQQQQEQRPRHEEADGTDDLQQQVGCEGADPLLCILVAPPSLDARSLAELQARARLSKLLVQRRS